MEKTIDVIGVENGIMDLALRIEKIPETDSSTRLYDYLWQPGGNASNAIVALARMGAECGMLGEVGTDSLGGFCRDDMTYHGVDVSHWYRKEGDTSFTTCLAEKETHGRSFLGRFGVDESLTDEEVDENYIAKAKYIHIPAYGCNALGRAIEYARRNNVKISLDAGGVFSEEHAKYIVGASDIIIMSEEFYHHYFHDDNYISNCRKLLEEQRKEVVIVTLGSKGCAGVDNRGESCFIPAFSGFEIVDTTGAGDVFHGGFLYAWMQGWDLDYCARFASAVSFIKCTSLGGRVGIPSRSMVEQFLKDGTIDYSDIKKRRERYMNIMTFNS